MPAWIEPTVEAIAQHFPALAEDLTPDDLTAFVGRLKLYRVRHGDLLLSQGSPYPLLYLLWGGTFILRTGHDDELLDLGPMPPHSIVGEIAFFDGGPVSASLVAKTDIAWALGITPEDFESFAASRPAAAAGIYRVVSRTLAARLREATETFERLTPVVPVHVDDAREAPVPTGLLRTLRTLFGLSRSE